MTHHTENKCKCGQLLEQHDKNYCHAPNKSGNIDTKYECGIYVYDKADLENNVEFINKWRDKILPDLDLNTPVKKNGLAAPENKDTGMRERFKDEFDGEVYGYADTDSRIMTFIEKEIALARNNERAEIIKLLQPCEDYCREVNGREDCKNCGFDMRILLSPQNL